MKLYYWTLLMLWSIGLSGQTWQISDIAVDQGGVSLDNPWTGGVSAPQFWPLDFDGDGIEDLLLFDRVGHRLMMFRASVDGGEASFTFNFAWEQTFPDFVQFVIPRDYTGDGIADLFVYSSNGIPGMQVYRGRRTSEGLAFDLVELDQPFQNVLIYELGSQVFNISINRIDLPSIVDVNGDGDLDILTYPSSGGSVHYYENLQVEKSLPFDQIRYRLADDCFGGFYESDFSEEIFLADQPGGCATGIVGGGSSRHSGSTILTWDRDADGVLDLLVGDFTSDAIVSVDLERPGGTYWATGQDAHYPSYNQSIEISTFVATYLFDVDMDGDEDLLAAPNIRNASRKQNNVLLYENVGTDSFDLRYRTDDFLVNTMIDHGIKSTPTFLDVNADGWMDIIMGTQHETSVLGADPASLIYYRHNGSADAPAYVLEDMDWLGFRQFSMASGAFAPVAADMDGDGDMDLIVGDQVGQLFYVENITGPSAPFAMGASVAYPWFDMDVGQFAVPAVSDVNGDGLPDLIVGERNANNDPMTNMICGTVNYFQNMGSPSSPSFIGDPKTSPNSECLGGINTRFPNTNQGMSAPTIFTTTGGEELFYVGTDIGIILQYMPDQIGEQWMVLDSMIGDFDIGAQSKPAFADVDRDGFVEMVVGGQGGGLMLFDTPLRTDGTVSHRDVVAPRQELVSVYPNPAPSGGQIHIEHGDQDWEEARLIGLDGRTHLISRGSGQRHFQLPLADAGIYLLQLRYADSLEVIKILIK